MPGVLALSPASIDAHGGRCYTRPKEVPKGKGDFGRSRRVGPSTGHLNSLPQYAGV